MQMSISLYKEMKQKEPSKKDVLSIVDQAKKQFPVDVTVDVKHTSHIGRVRGYNERTGGFYPGNRFPVFVEIIASDMDRAIGHVFEYGLNDLEVVDW